MTRIGVVSDSHGGRLHLERFAEICRAEKFDQVFHLGDVLDVARFALGFMIVPVLMTGLVVLSGCI